jgi:hypothetical protein
MTGGVEQMKGFIAGMKTLLVYWVIGGMIAVLIELMTVSSLGNTSYLIGMVLGYLIAATIYFLRRIPRWIEKKQNIYIGK